MPIRFPDCAARNPWRLFGLMTGLLLMLGASAATPPDPQQVVERADRIRFPLEAFQVNVTITTHSGGQAPEVREYRVLVKGTEDSLVQTLAPASERGQIMLMKGSDLWVYLPNVSQPVRLPMSQRLTGQVANGDLARANFAGDYTPELVGTEKIGKESYYVLELRAARKGVTYQRVKYWVNTANYRPLKAEFYTLSNRLLKTAHYRKYAQLGNSVRPTELVMEDALKKGERSVMSYRDMQFRDLPDKFFSKDFLKKLQ